MCVCLWAKMIFHLIFFLYLLSYWGWYLSLSLVIVLPNVKFSWSLPNRLNLQIIKLNVCLCTEFSSFLIFTVTLLVFFFSREEWPSWFLGTFFYFFLHVIIMIWRLSFVWHVNIQTFPFAEFRAIWNLVALVQQTTVSYTWCTFTRRDGWQVQ